MLDKRLNESIANIPLPRRMRQLPVSDKGFPVPWFVAWPDGKPDFRAIEGNKVTIAIRRDLCWLCGQTLGRFKCFVIGPMCGVNRVSSEPPSHRDCAEYAVVACPFLTKPRMRRNSVDLPDDAIEPAGIMIERNPGVTLLWVTHDYKTFRVGNGMLIRIGEPVEIFAYREGRIATRPELDESINTGLPALAKVAADQGAEAVKELANQVDRATALFKEKLRVAA